MINGYDKTKWLIVQWVRAKDNYCVGCANDIPDDDECRLLNATYAEPEDCPGFKNAEEILSDALHNDLTGAL
jgi:hypothetical protein